MDTVSRYNCIMQKLNSIISQLLPAWSAVILFLLVIYLVQKRENKHRLSLPGIPVVPRPKSDDFRAVLDEANAKYPDQPYMVPFRDPTVIIPAYCIEELKNLPDSKLSTNGSMYDRFAIRWAGSGWVDKELAHSIKYDLVNEVDSLFSTIQEEIQHSATQSLPLSDVWTSVPPQEALVQVVGAVIGRMMIGAPLSRDKKWLSASIGHAIAVVTYAGWLRQIPAILRPVFAYLLPQKRVVDESKRAIRESISPIIQKQLSGHGQTSEKTSSEQGRLVRWLLKRYKPGENPLFSPALVFRDHYSLCFAAIHGPTFLLVQAIIDLASYPQYIAPLREEIDRELAKAPFEKWTRETISRLTFTDAFCKESARMNPQGVIAWLRKTHKPITLSTGHVIPPNTLIAATNPMYNPSATPWIEDPNKFYPERWMEDRSNPHQDANYMFRSATIDSLIFGYGKHACPGRPFGVAVVKDMLAYIVSRWDVRLSGGRVKRPDNIHMDFMVMPPISPLGNLEIEFRLRK
ncbi:cytochrome P450 [Hypoxylon cercidicola]|nr:cytochrome P450 [Hypoxylon cercidicola]